jgi:hypothetical protein
LLRCPCSPWAALRRGAATRGDHNPSDQASARSIDLRRGDLPGWRARPAPKPALRCRSFAPDLSAVVETGSAASPEYTRGRLSVSSNAVVAASRSRALVVWHALATKRLLNGVREAFLRTPGIKLRRLVTSRLPFPRVAPRTAAFRASFVLTGFGDDQPSYGSFDFILLARAWTTAVLGAGVDGRAPFPADLARRLAGVLARRLEP